MLLLIVSPKARQTPDRLGEGSWNRYLFMSHVHLDNALLGNKRQSRKARTSHRRWKASFFFSRLPSSNSCVISTYPQYTRTLFLLFLPHYLILLHPSHHHLYPISSKAISPRSPATMAMTKDAHAKLKSDSCKSRKVPSPIRTTEE